MARDGGKEGCAELRVVVSRRGLFMRETFESDSNLTALGEVGVVVSTLM